MNKINSKSDKLWYVVYTRPRAEKKVSEEMTNLGIESYVPLQKQLRQWKDRKKWIEIPLITSYCFVRISSKEYYNVLNSYNVVKYVTFEGKAAVIPEKQIDSLKQMLKQEDFDVAVTYENFKPGKKVEVIEGPMIGMKGELLEIRGKNKFILRFDQIKSIFTAEVPASHLSFLPEEKDAD